MTENATWRDFPPLVNFKKLDKDMVDKLILLGRYQMEEFKDKGNAFYLIPCDERSNWCNPYNEYLLGDTDIMIRAPTFIEDEIV